MTVREIDWAAVSHAYGPATDVPDLLRALRSDDAEDRDGAFYDMYGSLYHQGSVYSATAAAVPFLVDVAVDPAYPDRVALLGFLVAACHGYDVGLPAVRAALAAELPRLVPLLDDPDPAVRVRAVGLLAAPELAAAAPDVHRATTDPDPAVRAAAWLCLADADPAGVPGTCPDDDGAVRLAWALAAAGHPGGPPGGAAAHAATLTALLDSGDALARLDDHQSAVTDSSPLVRTLPLLRAGAPDLLGAVCDVLAAEHDAHRAMSLYQLLLAVAFPQPAAAADLDGDRRRVLRAIAGSEGAWEFANVELALAEHGIEPRDGRDAFVAAYGTRG